MSIVAETSEVECDCLDGSMFQQSLTNDGPNSACRDRRVLGRIGCSLGLLFWYNAVGQVIGLGDTLGLLLWLGWRPSSVRAFGGRAN